MTMGTNVPRTQEHLSLLISDMPNAWEYLLFAGALIIEMEPLESRYADYKLGYAPRLGALVYEAQFPEYFAMQLGELKLLARNFAAIYADEVFQSALGPPGMAGDPAALLHLAKRYISLYNDLLQWVERLRGTSFPDKYSTLLTILAKYADQPIEAIRDFVASFAETAEKVAAMKEGDKVVAEHCITFSIPGELSRALSQEIDRMKLQHS